MDPITLIVNILIAVLVVIIIYLILMEALKQLNAGGNWPQIVKLCCLLLLLIWVLVIVFGKAYLISFPR